MLLRKLTAWGESVRDGFLSKEDCQLGLVIIHFRQYFQPSQQVRGVHVLGVGMKVASENTCPPPPQPDSYACPDYSKPAWRNMDEMRFQAPLIGYLSAP